MRFANIEEVRRLDAVALASATPIPGTLQEERLMRLVAAAVADATEDIARRLPHSPEIIALCGRGDNGYDARLAAEELARRGWRARAHGIGSGEALPPPQSLPRCAIAIDGILGIGMRGAPRPDAAEAIDWLLRFRAGSGASAQPARRFVVAVDLPSGMPADGGDLPNGSCADADFTVTAGLPKLAFSQSAALRHCGEILVADIGYGFDESRGRDGEPELATLSELHRALPRRGHDSHKGDFGHVVVVGGSARYRGAPQLAILGALRGGAGLVSAFVPQAVAQATAVRTPEAMATSWGDADALGPDALEALPFPLDGKTLCIGPGLGRAPETADAVEALLSTSGVAGFVLDADALQPRHLPAIREAASRRPVVLTPHPGEAARLMGGIATTAEIQRDRMQSASELSRLAGGATVLLKGAGTIAASPHTGPTLVAAGNPALSRGGSGDVLAGLCAALLARGTGSHAAAWGAALLHGRAADLAAIARGPEPVLPTDLANELWN